MQLHKARDIQRKGLKGRYQNVVTFVEGDGYDGLLEQSPYDGASSGFVQVYTL